jgi:hypothetical protein
MIIMPTACFVVLNSKSNPPLFVITFLYVFHLYELSDGSLTVSSKTTTREKYNSKGKDTGTP